VTSITVSSSERIVIKICLNDTSSLSRCDEVGYLCLSTKVSPNVLMHAPMWEQFMLHG
jgi:hypothetical protein